MERHSSAAPVDQIGSWGSLVMGLFGCRWKISSLVGLVVECLANSRERSNSWTLFEQRSAFLEAWVRLCETQDGCGWNVLMEVGEAVSRLARHSVATLSARMNFRRTS